MAPKKKARTSRSILTAAQPSEPTAGIREPKQESQYYERSILREYLFGKYKTGKIYVDSRTACPNKVWFLKKANNSPDEDNAYEISYPKAGVTTVHCSDIERYEEKWQHSACAGHPETNCEMLAMMLMCDALAECIQWKFNEADDDGWSLDQTKLQRYEGELDSMSNAGHGQLAAILGFGNLPMAMLESMTKTVGRHAISALFECAARVAFGNGYRKAVAVYPVGSSCAPRESFPVSSVASCRKDSTMDYERRAVEEAISEQGYSDVGETNSSASGFWEDGKLYADVLVASGHEPNWPRFLFVVETASGNRTSIRHKAQLIREMLGAIMYQTVVFGLTINSMKASMYDMHHDYEHKKIHVNVRTYSFQDTTNSRNLKFNATEFKNLFIDIVAAMEYGKSNIQEIFHGF